ncbi:hypothetical protein BN132_847 [Cronobacter turicensis 564]|nr:hypothetical protein BN132_847 [Cronobacter turicensis 564]
MRLASELAALHGFIRFIAVHIRAEQRQPVGARQRGLPFALVAFDHLRHFALQLLANPERILKNDLAQIINAAFQVIHPGAGALQAVGGADVKHQEAVDGAQQRLPVEIACEEIRVARLHAAVAADVEIPAFVGGDHAHILALRLSAFAGAAGDRHFNFVRRAQPFVAVLKIHREPGGILHAVAAPGGADARFHGTQRFPVGVAGLKARRHQLRPDCRELFKPRPEEIDTLAAGDFAVELIAFGDLPDGDKPVRRHFARRHPGYYRVRAIFLDIREVAIVSVLKRQVRRFQHIFVPARRQHRAHQRLADFAAVALAVAADELVERADMVDAHQVVNLLARIRKVLADIFFDRHALLFELILHHLFDQRATAAAAGRRFGAAFHRTHIACAPRHRRADIRLADVMTRADLRAFRQRRHAEPSGGRAAAGGQDQRLRLGGKRHAVEHHL